MSKVDNVWNNNIKYMLCYSKMVKLATSFRNP